MTFIGLLSKLTSSLASIQRVSAFALKHGPKCGDDIWDCLVDEASQVNLNARINLLYFLDTLLDKHAPGQPYKDLIGRDLAKLVEAVVPQTREGILNLLSATQVRSHGSGEARRQGELMTLRCFHPRSSRRGSFVGYSTQNCSTQSSPRSKAAENRALTRRLRLAARSTDALPRSLHTAPPGTSSLSKFSRNDILRRIEDDRERVRPSSFPPSSTPSHRD